MGRGGICGGAECEFMGGNANLNVFPWDLHCNPLSCLKPPCSVSSPWNVLVSGSSSAPGRIIAAAWMQACMHAHTQCTFPLSPSEFWSLRLGMWTGKKRRGAGAWDFCCWACLVIASDYRQTSSLKPFSKRQQEVKVFAHWKNWKRYRNVQIQWEEMDDDVKTVFNWIFLSCCEGVQVLIFIIWMKIKF